MSFITIMNRKTLPKFVTVIYKNIIFLNCYKLQNKSHIQYRDRSVSHVQHFFKTDYTEYSVEPNIRFPEVFPEYSLKPNIRLKRIFVSVKFKKK